MKLSRVFFLSFGLICRAGAMMGCPTPTMVFPYVGECTVYELDPNRLAAAQAFHSLDPMRQNQLLAQAHQHLNDPREIYRNTYDISIRLRRELGEAANLGQVLRNLFRFEDPDKAADALVEFLNTSLQQSGSCLQACMDYFGPMSTTGLPDIPCAQWREDLHKRKDHSTKMPAYSQMRKLFIEGSEINITHLGTIQSYIKKTLKMYEICNPFVEPMRGILTYIYTVQNPGNIAAEDRATIAGLLERNMIQESRIAELVAENARLTSELEKSRTKNTSEVDKVRTINEYLLGLVRSDERATARLKEQIEQLNRRIARQRRRLNRLSEAANRRARQVWALQLELALRSLGVPGDRAKTYASSVAGSIRESASSFILVDTPRDSDVEWSDGEWEVGHAPDADSGVTEVE